eukprot:12641554-Alexandrium_andersonii.AAC.1
MPHLRWAGAPRPHRARLRRCSSPSVLVCKPREVAVHEPTGRCQWPFVHRPVSAAWLVVSECTGRADRADNDQIRYASAL